ncbi:MAG: hypothetical protein V7607_3496 [Solirubrobacteraceae bacterium]
MLSRDEAPRYLARLAEPILAAFADARSAHAALLDAIEDDHSRLAPAVAGVFDGVSYWAFFATCLCEEFDAVAGVERLLTTHSLAHHWTVDAEVTVQLKSDTGNLPLDQLQLPGVARLRRSSSECVILTWDHKHSERFDPSFVQMDGQREAWRIPVVALLEVDNVEVAAPETPKANVTSARTDAAREDETNKTDETQASS